MVYGSIWQCIVCDHGIYIETRTLTIVHADRDKTKGRRYCHERGSQRELFSIKRYRKTAHDRYTEIEILINSHWLAGNTCSREPLIFRSKIERGCIFEKFRSSFCRTRPIPDSTFSIAIRTSAAIGAYKGVAWKLIFFPPATTIPLPPLFPLFSACGRSRKRRKGLTVRQSGSRRVDRRGSRQLPPLRGKRKRRRGDEKRGRARRETRLIRSKVVDSAIGERKRKSDIVVSDIVTSTMRVYLQVRLFPLWCFSGIAPREICANANRSTDSQIRNDSRLDSGELQMHRDSEEILRICRILTTNYSINTSLYVYFEYS